MDVLALAQPWRFISFFMNFSAAALSRVVVTKDSSTSPYRAVHLR